MKDTAEVSLTKKRRVRPMGSAASMCVDGAKMANSKAVELTQKLLRPMTADEYRQTLLELLDAVHTTQEELLTIPIAAREDLEREARRLGKTQPLNPQVVSDFENRNK